MIAMEAMFRRYTADLATKDDMNTIKHSIETIEAKVSKTDKRVDGLDEDMKNMKEEMEKMKISPPNGRQRVGNHRGQAGLSEHITRLFLDAHSRRMDAASHSLSWVFTFWRRR